MNRSLGNLKSLLLIGLCLLMLLLSVSCQKSHEEAPVPENEGQQTEIRTDDVKIEVDKAGTGASVEYKGEAGSISFEVNTIEGVAVPEDYPSGVVPLYPGGLITMAGKQEDTITVVIQAGDSIEDIYGFYEKNLKFDSVELKQTMSGLFMISGTVDDLYISVMATKDTVSSKDKNLITIAVMPES